MIEVADNLRALAAAIEARLPLDPAQRRWLEAAPWSGKRALRARRDELLRELARLSGDLSTSHAMALASEMGHYAAVGWGLDRARGAPYPDNPRRRLLFAIFRTGLEPLQSWRWIYDLINGDDCND